MKRVAAFLIGAAMLGCAPHGSFGARDDSLYLPFVRQTKPSAEHAPAMKAGTPLDFRRCIATTAVDGATIDRILDEAHKKADSSALKDVTITAERGMWRTCFYAKATPLR